MARFNTSSATPTIENRAGGQAYAQSPELELISLLVTSFVKDQFYRDANDQINRVGELVDAIKDKSFPMKAAILARHEFGMRSITHVLAAEVAARCKGEPNVRRFLTRVVRRPDDASEIMAYYLSKYGKPVPTRLKVGLAHALAGFNEYQLAKYRGDGKTVSLVDIANLSHPKANGALSKLMHGELKTFDTWESALSEAGSDENAKAGAWREMLTSGKIGYFALLRNIRNILDDAPDLVPLACEMLVDVERIKGSLVLPFRFLTAIKAIGERHASAQPVFRSLNRAVDLSLSNVPRFDGKTLVALDVSGSMYGQPAEIGSLFAAVLCKANDADLMTFDTSAHYAPINTDDSTLTIASSIPFRGGGTDFRLIFNSANRAYDRIIILSDMQAWVGYYTPEAEFSEYCKRFDCRPFVYSFDLQGQGDMQFKENNVFCVAGFSDKVFDMMALLEQDRNALLNRVREVVI